MSARPEPGAEMIFQWRKWDGQTHWRHECVYLGADDRGDWIGQPIGWHSIRPGAQFHAEAPNVTLVPASGDFALTVNRGHPFGMRVYIDLGWDIHWSNDPLLATGIDMDLDVIRLERDRDPAEGPSGTWVDDRDEWAEHSIRYGYPADVMAHLEELTLDLEARVRAQVAPFDDATADVWLDRLEALHLGRPRLDK